MISKQTAMDIALAYREIETAEELLENITQSMSKWQAPDIRDAFGRRQPGLQLGVPSGESSRSLYNVPWPLAKVVIEAHIAQQRSIVAALNERALIEAAAQPEASA